MVPTAALHSGPLRRVRRHGAATLGTLAIVGFIIVIVFLATQGNPGANRYGIPPPNVPPVPAPA
jgi:uncharacterized membrane protein YhaH (DUF805 family)